MSSWKKYLLFCLILAFGLFLLSACGQKKEQTASKPSAQSTEAGGKIVIGVTDKVTDLDPANAYDFYTWEVLNNVMGGLMKYKPGTTELEPYLAESYEIKNNNKVYIFHLRKDLKFADGTPCKAQDVVRSIKRVMKIKGDPSWLVTDFVKDVKALDDYTVEFVLKKPVSYFLAVVATPPYFPVSPKYAQDKIEPDQTAGGVGPYRIKKWVRDQELILEANPYFFGKVKNKEVIIRFYKDATTLRLALEKGDIDIAWRTLAPVDILSLKKSDKYQVIEAPGSFIRYMVVNVKMPPVKDKLVRKAIACIVDRNDIIKRVYMNTFAPLYSLVPQGMWSYEPIFKEKYGDGNIAEAKKLLSQAGYSESKKLKLELWWTPTHYGSTEKDLAQVLKEQLEKTGLIQVTLKSAEWSTYVDYLRKGAMMVSLLGWYPDYLDPDDFTTPFLKTGANSWTGNKYSNPTMDNLLEKASTVTDFKEREKLYKKVQEILAEDVPYVPLVQGKLFIVTQKSIKGIVLDPTMILSYSSIEKSQK